MAPGKSPVQVSVSGGTRYDLIQTALKPLGKVVLHLKVAQRDGQFTLTAGPLLSGCVRLRVTRSASGVEPGGVGIIAPRKGENSLCTVILAIGAASEGSFSALDEFLDGRHR